MKQPRKSLNSGRPPASKVARRSMSRKASRSLINKHHQLEKQRSLAVARGDTAAEADYAAQILSLGGLDRYQEASLQGQSSDRGGDTSKILLEWLPIATLKQSKLALRMLEVGSLSTQNACSKSGLFEMLHIDLHSQEPGIQKQDFMERPLPRSSLEQFDIVSLSLVLNFVPDPEIRGQMLVRTLLFLKHHCASTYEPSRFPFPSLFVVLPRSCIDNSRYFTEERFRDLMMTIGYSLIRSKTTQKLAYSLWAKVQELQTIHVPFLKQEINPGRTRNNFVITLKNCSPDITSYT